MPANGFSIIFGGDMPDPAGDDERAMAKAALRRFRNAESADEALDAFKTLCRWAEDEGKSEGEGY